MSEATASSSEPPPLAAANAPEALWSGTLITYVKEELERSARFLAFTPKVPDGGKASAEVAGVRATNNAIQTAVAEAAVKLLELASQLRTQNTELETAVTDSEKWYLAGDVTSLTVDELSNALDRHPIRDAKNFCEYLHRMIRKNLHQKLQADPLDDAGLGRKQEELQFKVMMATEAVRSQGTTGTFHAFHLLVWLMVYRSGFKFRRGASHLSLNLLAQSSSPAPRRIREILLRVIHPKERPMFSLGGAPGTEFKALRWAIPAFWDFARARRVLWHVYTKMPCLDPSGNGPMHTHHGDCCRRRWALTVLAPIQEAAWAEVKAKVHLVAGPKLPAELVACVLEAALDAEELPRDPCVWQKEMTSVPDLTTSDYTLSLGGWQVKDEYRCSTYVQQGKAE